MVMRWLQRILLILAIISLGTVIDFVVHETDPRFSVPDDYFPHKIFYGTLWAFIGFLVFRKFIKTHFGLAIVLSLTPAVTLQFMYFIQHHLLLWVTILFLILHFLMFLLPAYFIVKKYKGVFI